MNNAAILKPERIAQRARPRLALRSADWKSAVSQIGNLQARDFLAPADGQSAKQPTASRRHLAMDGTR
jgi:hypothetical protein